jgi:hypothetical protein
MEERRQYILLVVALMCIATGCWASEKAAQLEQERTALVEQKIVLVNELTQLPQGVNATVNDRERRDALRKLIAELTDRIDEKERALRRNNRK